MEQYEMTLVAVSEKRIRIRAESAKDAANVVEALYHKTNILDFSDADVTDISVVGIEREGKRTPADCDFYCGNCHGKVSEDSGYCGDIKCADCHWCCPDCGGCMHPPGEKLP